jgi:hypothetical protein
MCTYSDTLKVYIHLKSLHTVANRKIQPTEGCLCVDIHLYLNRESVTDFGQKPKTRLNYALSKLSTETQTTTAQEKLQGEAIFRESRRLWRCVRCTRHRQEKAFQHSSTKSLQSPPALPTQRKQPVCSHYAQPTQKNHPGS